MAKCRIAGCHPASATNKPSTFRIRRSAGRIANRRLIRSFPLSQPYGPDLREAPVIPFAGSRPAQDGRPPVRATCPRSPTVRSPSNIPVPIRNRCSGTASSTLNSPSLNHQPSLQPDMFVGVNVEEVRMPAFDFRQTQIVARIEVKSGRWAFRPSGWLRLV